MSPPPSSLVYYPDSRPGIRRKRRGRGFSYYAPDDTLIEQTRERARIAALAVPPAYENVWICPLPNGHLQATGFDARKRKQYRYHADWTAHRAELKYGHLAEFGEALPAIRRRIARDLGGDAGDRDYALAATLAMIDRMSVRVGNAGYAEENGAYGVTTLQDRHLRMTREGMVLSFTAKGGTRVKKTVRHKKLQKVLDSLHDLGGAELISWIGDDGEPHSVRSDMVNARLAEITGNDALTAKTFRTWNGSVAALDAALAADKISIKAMAEAAAEELCNTPTIARGSYIHPRVLALAEDPSPLEADAPEVSGLKRSEARLLNLLES